MIVLTLSKCPPGLKGDVTKWLMEISTGVYVGKLNARVRELLWKRVCEYCESGEATMVFQTKNEQGFSFYVHNTTWKPVDFDGITLLKKPLPPNKKYSRKTYVRNNVRKKKNESTGIKHISSLTTGIHTGSNSFVAIDLETTGLKASENDIIELAAVRFEQGDVVNQYHTLIRTGRKLPEEIIELTGITDELLSQNGIELNKALPEFLSFIGDDILVGHYIRFDISFLKKACMNEGIDFGNHEVVDTVALAKGKSSIQLPDYRLETMINEFKIAKKQDHRALPDAVLAAKVFLKLNEIVG